MKYKLTLLILVLCYFSPLVAQVFQVDTLVYHGDVDKCINMVILGDGFTETEQENFIANAVNLSDYLFKQAPWQNYKSYFNVFAIRVISVESGAAHPNTATDCNSASPAVPVAFPDTYFGCQFDQYNIHRLIVPNYYGKIINVLSTNFPNYDQVLIISNTPYYGGSGGSFATSTLAGSSSEITAHELGHSFAKLADEYFAGDIYLAEKQNLTQETDPSLVKWKNWMGYSGTGIYQHCCGGNSALWYRPHNNCKMRTLGPPYCPVCAQGIIETIHDLSNPILQFTPSDLNLSSSEQYLDFTLTQLITPSPNTLSISWQLDGADLGIDSTFYQLDQFALPDGMHTLIASVVDTTSLVRVDNHSDVHINFVSWEIEKTTTSLVLKPSASRHRITLYPNPTKGLLHVGIDLESTSRIIIELLTLDGFVILPLYEGTTDPGNFEKIMDMSNVQPGAYLVRFTVGNYVRSEKLVIY
ncbi:MAG: T9SS type A sorting domain-containing protein [Saprospiraceae bacterium]|nr:T9SS type A sorting domain-containing protein [Saprospiraceae bacterium]